MRADQVGKAGMSTYVYDRQPDNSWLLREASGLQASLAISTIGVELPLAEVYDRVNFAVDATSGE
jgi:hypothetical protein